MSSLKNKDRHILDRPSIFRLLDLSGLSSPPLCPRPWAFFSANLHIIFENLKQVFWYQRRIQDLVKYLKAVDYFYKMLHLRCLTVLWIWFPFWNKKKFIALNSVIKIQRIEQFWTQIKNFYWISHARSNFLKICDCK